MSILKAIADSFKVDITHHTVITNALIELENNAGLGGIQDLNYRLKRLVRAMRDRNDPQLPIAQLWLLNSYTYLETYGSENAKEITTRD